MNGRRRSRRRLAVGKLSTDDPLLRRWALRILLSPGYVKRIDVLDHDDLLDLTGLSEAEVQQLQAECERSPDQAQPATRNLLSQLLRREESRRVRESWQSRNARLVGAAFGLSKVEIQVLAFVIAATVTDGFASLLKLAPGGRRSDGVVTAVSAALGVDVRQVRAALRRLVAPSPALVEWPDGGFGEGPVSVTDWAQAIICRPLANERQLLAAFVERAPAASLGAADFQHLGDDVELLAALVDRAVRSRRRGVNILLHGLPGTGKTELARHLVERCGARGFEVRLTDDEGDPVAGHARLMRYGLSQHCLAEMRDAVLIFDELEDAFPSRWSLMGPMRESGNHKAWTNRLLERGARPTIWISNAIEQIDPAFVRRFMLRVEVKSPPRAVRRRIATKAAEGLQVSEAFLDQVADDTTLTPAGVQQAADVARLVRGRGARSARAGEALMRDVLRHNAAGQRWRSHTERKVEIEHDLDLVNVTVDLRALIAGLARSGRGRLCFYGPPGCGKSALAAHMAKELGVPLLLRRASDLLAPYVGQTEHNIAGMFREATAGGALLLIDEADSFLRDRAGAVRSWETTLVNEMLTQIEHYEGIVVCTTNLLDDLDRAAMRRFDMKIPFDWLRPDQVATLFDRTLATLHGTEAPTEHVDPNALASLTHLAPGDFAVVLRRATLMGETPTATDLIAQLRAEIAHKHAATSRRLGFGG